MKSFKQVGAVLFFLLIAQFGFAQDPGGGPDGPPPAVPFDDYIYLLLIVIGVVFTLFTLKKLQRETIAR